MILINEWLPNPVGSDADGEWVELANTGTETVSLRGYGLSTGSGKTFKFLNETISANGYLVLPRNVSKLPLVNNAGGLSFLDPQGELIDSASFVGIAPEGKSANRRGERIVFGAPTPGAVNRVSETAIMERVYPTGFLATPSFGTPWFVGLSLFSGVALSMLVVFILKRNHDLSELFFSAY